MNRLLCCGDSNTFGWDPRDPLGGCYARAWPLILQELAGVVCINQGLPGRRIPENSVELDALRGIVESISPDAMLILLGTNNRYLPPYDTAEQTAGKMDGLLAFLRKAFPSLPLLLLGLPPMDTNGEWVKAVNVKYAELAKKYALPYYDPTPLDLPLCFDGLHLTEEGHVMLAQGIYESGILNI